MCREIYSSVVELRQTPSQFDMQQAIHQQVQLLREEHPDWDGFMLRLDLEEAENLNQPNKLRMTVIDPGYNPQGEQA